MALLLSIGISSSLFVLFKYFDKYKVHTFTAIVVNYLVAALTGMLIDPNLNLAQQLNEPWILSGAALGLLFISLFNLIAKIAQQQGVAISVLANKMSLVIPVLLALVFLGESISILQIAGILLAVIGIYLALKKSNQSLSLQDLKWPIVLFVGSGILDFCLKLNQQFLLGQTDNFVFVAFVFLSAFVYGLIFGVFNKSVQFNAKNLLAGFILGVPNYFSIYFLMEALSLPGLQSAAIFPINNASILVLTTLLGFLLFKEKLELKNWLGLAFCAGGIILIAAII